MRILTYVLKRLFYLIPVLIGVTLLVFVISHAIPGDPARMMAGQKASRKAVENLAALARVGPVRCRNSIVRYRVGPFRGGTLGLPFETSVRCMEDLKDFFPATLELTLVSMIVCITDRLTPW